MTPKIQLNATELRKYFEPAKRDNGTKYWKTTVTTDWLTEFCRHAHGDMLPDDYKYEFIVDALDALIEYDDPEQARQAMTDMTEDSYHGLATWLGSSGERYGYCDEAVKEFGGAKDIAAMIQLGMSLERSEVFDAVASQVEDFDDTTEDTFNHEAEEDEQVD